MKTNMKYVNKTLLVLVVLLLAAHFMLSHVNARIASLKAELEVSKRTCDSLQSECFAKEIQRQRLEYILDRAQDELPTECQEQLNEIKGQTE